MNTPQSNSMHLRRTRSHRSIQSSSMLRTFAFALAALLPNVSGLAQDAASYRAKIEPAIESLREKYKAVGLAVGVVKDRKLVYCDGFGLRDVAGNQPVTSDSIFRIASISKSFSATSVLQLVDKGKLSLEDEVTKLIGFEVKNPNHPDVPITLKMLLQHTSSVNDSQGYFNLDSINPATNENSSKCYNNYAPGTQYQYCNLNFNMVGAIIERASGLRFDRYIAKNILEPLGIPGGFNTNELAPQNHFATLYQIDTASGEPIPQPSAYSLAKDNYEDYQLGYSAPRFSPTGGMKTSVSGLTKYMNMHLGQGESDGVRVLSQQHSQSMQTVNPKLGNYGLALMSKDSILDGKSLIGHTGAAYGLYSMMFFSPEENFGLVLMTNGCIPTRSEGNTAFLNEAAQVLYDQIIAPDSPPSR